MKKLIVAVLAVVVLSGCTDPQKATRVLKQQGYTNINAGGHAWWACSDDDTYSTKFTATSVNGHFVSGAVCSGFLKGSTIRVD